MSDDKLNTGNPDRNLINMSEDYEVRYWAEKFGVTAEQLQDAISKSGTSSAEKVEEYLKQNQ